MTEAPTQDLQTRRAVAASWGLLVVRLLARGYLVFLVALAACATVPMAFGLTATVVQSGSMMPHIGVGDVVLSRPLPANAATPLGRVVTFPAPTGSAAPGIRLHRIIGTNSDGSLITAGDANRDADSAPLARADIIAVGCLLVPWIGLPTFWLQHGLLLPLLGWLAVTLLALIIEFLASRTETKERRETRPVPVGRSRRHLPVWVRSIGAESALSIVALILCAIMVALAPITPTVSSAFTATTVNAASNWVAAIPAVASRLAFTTNPSNSTGGVAFAGQPRVAIQTSTGGSTTSTAAVTLAITSPGGATLDCTANPVTAVAGTAQFAGCEIDKAGTYSLTATSPSLASATSATFTVTVGPANKLVFTSIPGNTARNTVFTKQPVVVVQDAGGNTVTSSAISITLSIVSGSLVCTANPKTAVAGVATFSGCRINQVGNYAFTATSGSLSGVSPTFFIFSIASKLTFISSPSSSTSSTAFGVQPVVAIQDGTGDTTSGTNSITLTITTAAGATLTCGANPVSAVNGTAAFSGCAIDKAGTYTLRASASSLTSATSVSFTISVGAPSRLSFTASPSNSVSSTAFATQPVVKVLDTFGNVTTSTASVTLAITTPGGATLTCTSNPKAAVAGVATFAGCRIDRAGSYTLTASASGLTSAASSTFTISAGAAARVVFTTSPGASVHQVAFPKQPVVAIQDAAGNVVSTSVFVTLTITAPTGGAVLTCTLNPVLTSAGVGTFSGCRIDRAGTYTVTASSSSLTSGVSSSFVVS
ncbi:MAG: S26 family signal peptidase [Pseudolysinimonas sp.]